MSRVGLVYKLSKNGKDYYGSTCMSMAQRMSKHRQHNKSYTDKNKSCSSKELFEDGIDPEITILETVMFNELKELRATEDTYIRANPCINKCGATFDRKVYEDKNRVKINQQQKDRRKLKDMTEKIVCDRCGTSVLKEGIYRHRKTKKCMKKKCP
jgi:hypothetical protein